MYNIGKNCYRYKSEPTREDKFSKYTFLVYASYPFNSYNFRVSHFFLYAPNMNEIVKMKVGSHLYGTNTPLSDTDFKGVYMPSIDDIVFGDIKHSVKADSKKHAHEKNTPNDIDCEMFSIHCFISMACDGDVCAIDMLHAPESSILNKSDIWDFLVSHRSLFYTRNLVKLTEYARKQAAKYGIKGSRLNACKQLLTILEPYDSSVRLEAITDKLPIGEFSSFERGKNNGNPEYQILDKRFQPRTKILWVRKTMEAFWKRHGSRAEAAARNEGIDWKALSHAVRAALQTRYILTNRTLSFPFPPDEAKLLIDIKTEKLDYVSVVAPLLENLMSEIHELADKSDLPLEVDRSFWRSFLRSIVLDNLQID